VIKIFIDQGHNPSGFNAGAEGNGLREQDITYQVGVYLAGLLNADPRFEARLSRNSPDEVLGTNNSTSLQARVRAANSWPADYFISIHANASVNSSANGSEIYVYNTDGTPAFYMAEDILARIVANVGTKDNGVRENRSFYVLRRTAMPALLIELAYISNASDAEKLENDQYLFAYSIYQGILDYFGYSEL